MRARKVALGPTPRRAESASDKLCALIYRTCVTLSGLVCAEFEDPLLYIQSIRAEAQLYGQSSARSIRHSAVVVRIAAQSEVRNSRSL